jgi:hypothetical protein
LDRVWPQLCKKRIQNADSGCLYMTQLGSFFFCAFLSSPATLQLSTWAYSTFTSRKNYFNSVKFKMAANYIKTPWALQRLKNFRLSFGDDKNKNKKPKPSNQLPVTVSCLSFSQAHTTVPGACQNAVASWSLGNWWVRLWVIQALFSSPPPTVCIRLGFVLCRSLVPPRCSLEAKLVSINVRLF